MRLSGRAPIADEETAVVDSAVLWTQVAQLVVKNRVSLGVLGEDQRPAALALAWATLPATPMTEPEVNRALKAALSGAARCLGTDHVELRRWLVDARWLTRDGFGREYRRVRYDDLMAFNQPWARLWTGVQVTDWVAEQRDRHEARRAERRFAWQGSGQHA